MLVQEHNRINCSALLIILFILHDIDRNKRNVTLPNCVSENVLYLRLSVFINRRTVSIKIDLHEP